MIQIDEAVIRKVIFHNVDSNERGFTMNNKLYDYKNDEEGDVLKKIFLKPFLSGGSTFEFKHDIDLELNPLFKFSQSILEGDDFIKQSQNICQHLKTVSKHPNIKDGELFIIKYDDIKIDNEFFEALGIYKIENKESYIETKNEGTELIFRKGIGSKRLDKACLIIYTKEPFTILVLDNSKTETDYWQNEFIKMGLKNDYFNNTNQFLSLTKSFVTKQFASDFEISKTDQIDLLNRSVEYFKTHDVFEKIDFEKSVLQNNDVINSFRSFNNNYQEENNIEISNNFEISSQAVKKQAKVFKRVLKLDKNFHIYIHGDRQLIEQGIDDDGRKYYKIYYKDES